MPATSKAQSRALNAKFGHAWVKAHHFDNPSKSLPDYADPRRHLRKRRRKKGK